MNSHICKICGRRFLGAKKKRFCSQECFLKGRDKQRSCDPCDDCDLRYRIVIFKNGTDHVQQYCVLCRRTRWVSKEIGRQAGLYDVDFLTDAAREAN
jgi:hypothetical protein